MQLPGVRSIRWLVFPPHATAVPPACIVEFDSNDFHASSFDTAQLAMPAAIAASVHKRQAEYFHGRLAARLALARLGFAGCDVPTGRLREPLWPQGVIGSISHSSSRAAAVVWSQGDRRGIGLDIEPIGPASVLVDIADVVANHEERNRLDAASIDRAQALTILFSAKESLFKATSTSVGRHFGFEAARLHTVEAGGARVWLEIQEHLCYGLHPGALCAVDVARLDEAHILTGFAW